MKKNLVLVFALCAIPALLQAAAPMKDIDERGKMLYHAARDPKEAGQQLIRAARNGYVTQVKRLLELEVDVDATDFFGITALITAAWGGA